MNKKKYLSVYIFVIIIVVGSGVAYYFNAPSINGVLGIDSSSIDAVSDGDISLIDSDSSSLPVADLQAGSDTAVLPPALPKKTIKSSSGISKSVTAISQTGGAGNSSTAYMSSGDDASDSVADATIIIPSSATTSPPFVPCSFPLSAPSTTREIIFNEIAWMGSSSSSNAEWMEVKNISPGDINLSGWQLMDTSGKIKISFSMGDTITSGGLFLLSRGADSTDAGAKIYSGDLTNTGDVLALMDPRCVVSDYFDATAGWPGGNNTTKQTLERDADGVGWHTSALSGGTPGAENSAGPPPTQYKLMIAFQGDAASATIASDPAGLTCAASCVGTYASGTQITLTPTAGPSAEFSGWSGPCYGQTVCSFTITANTSLTASFRPTTAPPGSGSGQAAASSSDSSAGNTNNTGFDASSSVTGVAASSSTDSGASPAAADHILISAVQIAGASSSNDLVRLYNPTASAVDMSGWKLHKKSATGTDYSLKTFPTGSMITAGQSFVWANSLGGFSETIGADVSSTETLSADNSIALMDAAGNVVDAVAWGTGSDQYVEGSPYPTDPGANQLLSRRSSDGAMVDTNNNTNDFTLQ